MDILYEVDSWFSSHMFLSLLAPHTQYTPLFILFPVKEVNFIFSASGVFLKWVSRCSRERERLEEVEEQEREKKKTGRANCWLCSVGCKERARQ